VSYHCSYFFTFSFHNIFNENKQFIPRAREAICEFIFFIRLAVFSECLFEWDFEFFLMGSEFITLNYISSLSFYATRNIFRFLDRGFNCLHLDGIFFPKLGLGMSYKFLSFSP